MATSTSSPYVEPNIVTILILASFLLLANVLNHCLDRLLYCGLIGQVLLGVAWGTPGSKWLAETTEATIIELGYLGLILLVFEGGLSTSFTALKANLLLSIRVTLTGIGIPIALSFVLTSLANATYLQAFAAGAALCSTSLGTTFTVLHTSGLTESRLGVVLVSAAMMDDVVGLVMVQVVSNLGGLKASVTATEIIRPVLVSLAFAIFVPVACKLVVKPIINALNRLREANPHRKVGQSLSRCETALAIHTTLLVALTTAASYAGTSNLFAAYLAGASISWWDTEAPHVGSNPPQETGTTETSGPGPSTKETAETQNSPDEVSPSQHTRETHSIHVPHQSPTTKLSESESSGVAIYERFYKPVVQRILKPFFFASVGFSIPISRMFSSTVVWKGAIYTILMAIGKLACGIWLVRITVPQLSLPKIPHAFKSSCWGLLKNQSVNKRSSRSSQDTPPSKDRALGTTVVKQQGRAASDSNTGTPPGPSDVNDTERKQQEPCSQLTSSSPRKPRSLYPPAILASAMVARGEIGFLISALAQSNGIFDVKSSDASNGSESELFLLVTWAIVLCTLIGPVCVGILVRRVKKLERQNNVGDRTNFDGRGDVLGVWGVQ
ncbi:MAG: hypothetical protein Q9165_008480 [Trypethelium subeluteriae]